MEAKLPKQPTRDSERKECGVLLEKAKEQNVIAVNGITIIADKIKFSRRQLTNDEEGVLAQIMASYSDAWRNAAEKIDAFETKVLKEAPEYKDEEDQKYRRWTIASYFLYSLGWSLGLLGKIYGVESGGGD